MMNSIVRFADYGAGAIFVAAALAGCGGSSPPIGAPGATTALSDRPAAVGLTMPHFVQGPIHPDHGRSWMSPSAKSSKALLYVGDDETDDVFVYDYKSGKLVGALTGFDGAYGECVDAKGDIYIGNFDAEDVVEYAHGGTTLLNTYDVSGGTPIGCAVDSKGDVAATSFDPGEVTVYAKGNPNKGTTYSDSACHYQWTMGYDNKGNLVGGGEDEEGRIGICALLAGSKTMTTLSTSGFTTDFVGGTTWDGKYLAIADQAGGILQASLKGTTLTYVGETTLSDDCYNDYVDDVNPFIVGKKNTPVNDKQGNADVGPNLWCESEGKGGKVDYWHYPAGGLPYAHLSSPPADPYGAAVSIAQ